MKNMPLNRFSLYMSLLGVAIIAGGVFWGFFERSFVETSLTAKGVVVGLQKQRSTHTRRKSGFNRDYTTITFAPVVQFTTDRGKAVTFISKTSDSMGIFEKGDRVTVSYDPSHPDRAEIKSFFTLYFGPTIVVASGLLLILFVRGMIAIPKLLDHRKKSLKQNGKPLQTTFVEVRQNNAMELGGRHPFKVITRWVHPTTKAEHLFESRNLWSNPADRINRDTIVVYQDRNNPKKYFMDLSFLDS